MALTRLPDGGDPITSRRNPLARRIAELDREPALRQRDGVCLAWGWKIVQEALTEPDAVERLFLGARALRLPSVRPLLRRARQFSLPVTAIEERLLDELLPGAGDQACLAVVRSRRLDPDAMVRGRTAPLLVVADRIQDPGNLGTVVRVGEAAGIAGLLTVPGTVDPHHTRAVRASAGSILRIPVGRISSAAEFALWCRERRIRLIATVPGEAPPCHRIELTGGVALVLGNEGEGLTREWTEAAESRMTIPLTGGAVGSLNVALAAAILLYEAVRQRSG